MKNTMQANDLARLMVIASKVVNVKNMNVPLQSTLLAFDKNELTLTASSGETTVVLMAPCKSASQLTCLVQTTLLTRVSASLEGEITYELKGDKLLMSDSSSRHSLSTIPTDEYPSFSLDGEILFALASDELSGAFKSVSFATAKEDSGYPVLSGICFSGKNKVVSLAATDRFVLAEEKFSVPNVEKFSCVVPASVASLLPILSDSVTVKSSDHAIIFSSEGATVSVSKFSDDPAYPDYSQLIPTKFATTVVAKSNELLKALKSAMIYSDISHVALTISADQMTITGQSKEMGNGESELSVTATGTNDKFVLALNAKYLLEIVKVSNSDGITLCFNLPTQPMVVRGDNKDRLGLLVPVKM